MEGFKNNPKMKSDLPCFKEGGSVSKAPKMKAQSFIEQKMAQKKAKSPSAAVAKEKEAPVEFAAKKGGRCKKDGGKVKRYKTGGVVNAKEEEGKPSGDKDKIKKVKEGAKKAEAPSAAVGKKPVEKFALGGLTDTVSAAVQGAKPAMQTSAPSPVPGYNNYDDYMTAFMEQSKINSMTPGAPQISPMQPPNPGMKRPGMKRFGMGRPGMGRPGMGRPGMGRPGMGRPGMGRPGTAPTTPNVLYDRMPPDQMRPQPDTSGVLIGFGPTDAPIYSNDPNAVGYTGMGRGGAIYVDGILQNPTPTPSMPLR